jgi:hypothetical protein
MRQELVAELEHAVEEGVFPRTISPAAAFRILTMGVLGVAVMRLSGRLAVEPADALVDDVLNVTLAGLMTGVALGSDSKACGDPADGVTEYHEGNRDHAHIRD